MLQCPRLRLVRGVIGAFALTVALLAPAESSAGALPPTTLDSRALRNHLLGLPHLDPLTPQPADFNGDGALDAADLDGVETALSVKASPARTSGSAAVYDPLRHQLISYGGEPNGPLSAETWSYTDGAWIRREESSPLGGRFWHAMAFDTQRGVAVLTGGLARSGAVSVFLNDTAERNGNSWTDLGSPLGTTGRIRHAMAYDSHRGVMVLFGGGVFNNGGQWIATDDTWEFDHGAWVRRAVSGPSARMGHAMAFDDARGVTVLFGGDSGGAETWEWDGAAWTQRAVAGPSARVGHSLTYDSARHVAVLFGGNDGKLNGETWEWDGQTWVLRAAAGPCPRIEMAAAFDTDRKVTLLFGGASGQPWDKEGDTWEWDGATWTLRLGSSPPVSGLQSAATYNTKRRTTLLLARDFTRPYEWDGDRWTQPPASALNPQDCGCPYSMVYDAARDRTLATGPFGTWEWDGTEWFDRGAMPHPELVGHAMVYDSQRGVSVLFGGGSNYGYQLLAETWEWNGTAWSLAIADRTPSARSGHAMAFDSVRNRIVLYGGYIGGIGPSTNNYETWERDHAFGWFLRTADGPVLYPGGVMAFDARRAVTVLIAPKADPKQWTLEAWEWDGQLWQRVAPPPFESQSVPTALAYDEGRGVIVAIYPNPSYNGSVTWEWDGTEWRARSR